MQTSEYHEPRKYKLPNSLAEILNRNPALWQGDSSEENNPVNNMTDTVHKEKTFSSSEEKQLSQEQKNEAREEDHESEDVVEDYFISKPVNSVFEINLAEFPIAYLNRGQLPEGVSKTKYQYKDIIKGREGKPIERVWTIEAHATDEITKNGVTEDVQLGFGGPATLEVIYELFQMWKEQGFKESMIHVGTFYNLLKRLEWGTGNSQYKQLRKTLQCIHGLHIKGKDCFYIPENDSYEQIDIYPFPGIYTYTKKQKEIHPDDYVYVSVDARFFNAIKRNTTYYIPMDRFYFKTLKPMEQKLALMLSKIFTPYRKKQRFEWKRNIFDLANQIPILSDKPIRIRQQLKRICEGLIEKNFPFLSSFKIEGDTIIFQNNMQTSLNLLPDNLEKEKKDYDTVEWLINEQLKICRDEHSRAFYVLVAKYVPVDMIYQALSEARQEGKVKSKLYTKIILERAQKYLEPYLKKAKQKDGAVFISDDEANRINNELLIERERFNSYKNRYGKKTSLNLSNEEKEELNSQLEQERQRMEEQIKLEKEQIETEIFSDSDAFI